jgi:hypothetical protein
VYGSVSSRAGCRDELVPGTPVASEPSTFSALFRRRCAGIADDVAATRLV